MIIDDDEQFYVEQVASELALAAVATDLVEKINHLNSAARYATLRELSLPPHAASGCGTNVKRTRGE